MSKPQKRLHTLLTDRAVAGLDAREREELQYLLAGAALDPSYEQAAAAMELALHDHGEAVPEYVEAAVLVQAGRYYGFTEAQAHEPTIGKPPVDERDADPQLLGGPEAQPEPAPRPEDSAVARNWELSPGVETAIESGVLESSLTDGRIEARGPAESQQAPIPSDLEPTGRAQSRRRRDKPKPAPAPDDLDFDLDDDDDGFGDLDDSSEDLAFDPEAVGQSQLGPSASVSRVRSTSIGESRVVRWATYVSAIAALVMLSIALWLFVHRNDGVDPADLKAQVEAADDVIEWEFATKPDPSVGEGASGSVIWSSELQAGVMVLDGLDVNDASDLQYQLWIVDTRREGPPVDGGVFDVGSEGEVEIPIDAKLIVGEPGAFVITVERPGGVVVSGQDRVAMVAAAG